MALKQKVLIIENHQNCENNDGKSAALDGKWSKEQIYKSEYDVKEVVGVACIDAGESAPTADISPTTQARVFV